MQADLGKNYFELFDLPVAFDLDSADLAVRYRELQRRFHPDRFASAAAPDRLLSVQLTAQINAAFQTLKEPVTRAHYLLGLQGIDTDQESDTSMNPAFLMEQMELREALEEASLGADRGRKIEALRQQVDRELELKSATLRSHFAENSREALGRARNLVREMLFLRKLAEEIRELD